MVKYELKDYFIRIVSNIKLDLQECERLTKEGYLPQECADWANRVLESIAPEPDDSIWNK